MKRKEMGGGLLITQKHELKRRGKTLTWAAHFKNHRSNKSIHVTQVYAVNTGQS